MTSSLTKALRRNNSSRRQRFRAPPIRRAFTAPVQRFHGRPTDTKLCPEQYHHLQYHNMISLLAIPSLSLHTSGTRFHANTNSTIRRHRKRRLRADSALARRRA
jgi:hypothetical protein